MSREKVISLIDNIILKVSADNFSKLKEEFSPLHIRLLEKLCDQLIDNWDELTLDTDDYAALLKSSNITLENKNKIYKKL